MTAALSLRFRECEPGPRLVIEVAAGRGNVAVAHFGCEEAPLVPAGDALFTLGYLPACELGYDLHIDRSVSRPLVAARQGLHALYAAWYGLRRMPEIVARPDHGPGDDGRPPAERRRTALFFSGGVDSFYSLISARDEIDALVLVVGADLDQAHQAGAQALRRLVSDVAQRESLPAIVVTTDARRSFDRLALWGEQFNGVMLAAIAHMLGGRFDRALVAGSSNAQNLAGHPWGSHPDHEPRYSSPAMQIEHHGAIERLEKIRLLMQHPDVLSRLRVCWRTADGSNCGVCSKCSQLRLSLRYLGGTAAEAAFACTDRSRETVSVGSFAAQEYWTATGRAALAAGDAAMALRIARAVNRYHRRAAWRLPAWDLRMKRLRRRWRASMGRLFQGSRRP